MRFFGKLFGKKELAAHAEASQEAADLAQIKKREEYERLYAAATTFPRLGEVGPPSTLASEAGGAPEAQQVEDNAPLENQEEHGDNILLRIWEEEKNVDLGDPMIRDIVADVEEVDAKSLLDELVSFSRWLTPTALIVDDDASIRELLARALANYGWRSAVVQGGEMALQQLQGRRFDLIVLDLVMPGMNGAQTFREIRKVDPTANVLIITAYPDSALMAEALQVGPFAIMRKPISLEELRVALRHGPPAAEPARARGSPA
jgi:CheY-like chemotaxis protein